MKKIIGIVAIAGGLIFFTPATSNAQVVIKVKPPTPKVVVVKPKSPKNSYVWIPGHWNWNKKKHKYVWVDGHWSKPKKGKVWIPGHYNKVRGGWKWVPGHWKKA